MSINVWTSYFDCKDETHQKEILRAIELNTANPEIDMIFLLCEIDYPVKDPKINCIKIKEQPTYAVFIDYMQSIYDEDYNILINSDIVLDYKTTHLFKTIPEASVYALSRYDVDNHNYYEPMENWKITLKYCPHASQDTWAFYKTSLDISQLEVYMGADGCDNRIAALLSIQGLQITNPCLSIKTYHIHSSQKRNYTNKYDKINHSLRITASRINDRESTIYINKVNGESQFNTYNKPNIDNVLDTVYNKPIYNDLAVGLVFFNSSKSKRLLMNYLYIVEKLRTAGIPYYTLELVYEGRQPEIADAFHVRGKSPMFHKEQLCYLLEKRIPDTFTKLLFLDADLVFSDPNWYNNLSEALNTYEVVHPFTNAVWLNLEYNNILEHRLTCIYDSNKDICDISNKHVGFAWAFQRSYYNEVGMFRYAIVGSGDSYSSMLFLNNHGYLNYVKNPSLDKILNIYLKSRSPSISHLNGNIYHLFHGSKANRKYQNRHGLLDGIFDIMDILVENKDGVFEFTNQDINSKIYNYLKERNDDGLF